MSVLHAVLLGLIEGITEYLPVSANAHVIILGTLLREPPDLVKTFAVALQAAPMLAVLLLYWHRFEALLIPSTAGLSAFKGRDAWLLMALGTLPVLITGFLFKQYFYGLMLSPLPSVVGLGAGGVAILLADAWHTEGRPHGSLDRITPAQALGVGLIQCAALWPGVSRSGATIIAGLLVGLNRKAAAEFSFLISVPVFAAAAALEFHKSDLLKANLVPFGIAFAVSFICAALSVGALMAWLGRRSFKPFGWYRLALSPVLWVFFHS